MPTLNTKTSIVDYLKSKGLDSSFANRQKLGLQYGVDYSKTTDSFATQNSSLLSAMQKAPTPNATTGAGTGAMPGYSAVKTEADANAIINGGQVTDAASVTSSGEPATRKTTADIMKEITTMVTPAGGQAETPNYTDTLNNYRSEYGITSLETQLDDLRAQEEELLAIKSQRTNAERGKTVATNVIEGRVGEVERQENERIGVIQRSISNATNQLNTKYNIVNSLMKTKEMDYNTATQHYDKEMANNISMFNAAKGIEEAAKTEEEHLKDDARSNAQIALNAYVDSGATYDTLSNVEKTNLTKLGVQSGLGADFFSNVLKVGGNKPILTTVVSADDTKATIIYKDGTTKTISTGLPAKKVAGTTATKTEIKEQQMQADRQTIMKDVGSITGTDRKVDPVKMSSLRQDIALNNPELLSWFDNAYEPKNMLNATNYPRAVRENQWLNK